MMFPAPAGSDRAQALAAEVGCTVGEFSPPFGHMRPALIGKVSGFSKALETLGGRFDRRERVYVFPSWPTLEAALQHVISIKNSRSETA